MKKNKHKKMDKQDTTPRAETTEPAVEQTVKEDSGNLDAMEAMDEAIDQADANTIEARLAETEAALEKEKKEYLFLLADFDNFRKRTLKEKSELLKNGAETAMKGILPIVDDFERGLDAIRDTSDADAVKEGMQLIYNKFVKYLEQNGVKPMESTGADFDPDLHEAVALVPGPEEMKNKVIDTVQKGYMLNDKVLRHAKVAVGQ